MATVTAPAKEAALPPATPPQVASSASMRTVLPPVQHPTVTKLPKDIPKSPLNGSAHSNGSAKKHSRPTTPLSRHPSGEHGHGHGCECQKCSPHIDVFTHVHPQGCGCSKCTYTEITHIGEAYCPNPNTTRFKDYETKVRIIQKIPEMRKVEKTVLVKQLVHEERTQTVRKSRVVMEDVETWEKVPVIREVPRLKKIIVHKIHEEFRTVTDMVPVIEYQKRTRQRTIPKCLMEDIDEIVEVPVIKEIPVVKIVQEPTGGFCEQPIEEYCTPGDFNILCKDGRHDGAHHKHKTHSHSSSSSSSSDSESDSDDEKSRRGRDHSESPKKRKPLSPIKTKFPETKPKTHEESHHELKTKLPETKPKATEAKFPAPETHPTVPTAPSKILETHPNVPEMHPKLPEIHPKLPETHAKLPETKAPAPEAKAPTPETKAPTPETKPKVADTKPLAPASAPKAPEVKNPAPETKPKVPEAAKPKVPEAAKPKSPEDGKKVDLTKLKP